MEINQTISKYVLTERVGHRVLSINIEINQANVEPSPRCITCKSRRRNEHCIVQNVLYLFVHRYCARFLLTTSFLDSSMPLFVFIS